MSSTIDPTTLHSHMLLCAKSAWTSLIKKTHDPKSTQLEVLREILEGNSGTSFGKRYGFDSIQTYEEFCAAVPIQTYETLRAFIEGQEETEECLLTAEHPVGYAQTSGTTGSPKYVPILPVNLTSLQEHQELATFAQYHGVPTIFDGKILVLSSPSREGTLKTGTPYGSMSGLLHDALPDCLKEKDVLPSEVLSIKEYDKKYLAIAAHAVAESHLSLIATANPSTIVKLLEVIRQNLGTLIQLMTQESETILETNIPKPNPVSSQIKKLKNFLGQEDQLTLASFWPNLRALVTWTGGSCGLLIPRVKSLLPAQAAVVEMGYLSSECIGSLNVDVQSNLCIPTFYENFFEFVEEDKWESEDAPVLTLEQVEEGKKYYVIVTTRNGLYRYFMNDIIEVIGHFNQTPTIQFMQKGKGVTNLTGEKLYEHQVTSAINSVKHECEIDFEFFLMLADPIRLEYTLFIEHCELDQSITKKFEGELSCLNLEYKAKRESGRLQPLKILYVEQGTAESYKQHCLSKGQREAQFKVVRLQYLKDCSFDFHKYARR